MGSWFIKLSRSFFVRWICWSGGKKSSLVPVITQLSRVQTLIIATTNLSMGLDSDSFPWPIPAHYVLPGLCAFLVCFLFCVFVLTSCTLLAACYKLNCLCASQCHSSCDMCFTTKPGKQFKCGSMVAVDLFCLSQNAQHIQYLLSDFRKLGRQLYDG